MRGVTPCRLSIFLRTGIRHVPSPVSPPCSVTQTRESELPGRPRPASGGIGAGVTLATVEERLKSRGGLLALWLTGSLTYAAITLLMQWGGVPGWDEAAHLYKASLVREGQSVFWDNFWYGGSYGAVTYGFVYYWLVQYVPARMVVVIAAGVIPPLYYIYQRRMWRIDDVWPAWLLAGVMAIYLAHGQDPFVVALALSVAGLALLATGRPLWGALPVAIGVFVNPMGLVVTGILMLADFVARPETRRRYLVFFAPLVPVVAVRVLFGWSFAEPGSYLNETSQLLMYLGFALAGVALAGVNAVHPRGPFVTLFLIYAAVCVTSFVIPDSPLGNNIGRFFMVFGLPLMFLLRHSRLRRPFPHGDLAIVPIVLFALLQFGTPIDHYSNERELPQTRESFFAPALMVARERHDSDHRIHVVALRRHWEALYFPQAGFPITRGWYRQADAIHNGLFYTNYDAASYARWLRRMGVEYVFLPDAPLDPWSRREARLLAESPEFEVAERAGKWTIYRLLGAEGLAVGLDGGRARVTALGHRSFSVAVDRPGSYLVKITWSPYWELEGNGRLVAGSDGFIQLEAAEAGTFTARIDVDVGRVLGQAREELGR